jgi:hypothetical protein
MVKNRNPKKKILIENIDNEKSPYVPEKVEGNEDRQFFWFIAITLIVFASFLVPYFYFESKKNFEFENIYWTVEEHNIEIYHGIFPKFTEQGGTYNIYLRNDPRENDVPVSGELSSFTKNGFVSVTPEFEQCVGGGVYRMIIDLSGFLRGTLGMQNLEAATTSLERSEETNTTYIDCTSVDQTVIILQTGNESLISQSPESPGCYTIQVRSCDDVAPIEKFIVETYSTLYKILNVERTNSIR